MIERMMDDIDFHLLHKGLVDILSEEETELPSTLGVKEECFSIPQGVTEIAFVSKNEDIVVTLHDFTNSERHGHQKRADHSWCSLMVRTRIDLHYPMMSQKRGSFDGVTAFEIEPSIERRTSVQENEALFYHMRIKSRIQEECGGDDDLKIDLAIRKFLSH